MLRAATRSATVPCESPTAKASQCQPLFGAQKTGKKQFKLVFAPKNLDFGKCDAQTAAKSREYENRRAASPPSSLFAPRARWRYPTAVLVLSIPFRELVRNQDEDGAVLV